MQTQTHYTTLVELLCDRAAKQAQQPAYTFLLDGEDNAQVLTYGALDQQARSIAAHLQRLGLQGSRAILIYSYQAGLEFIAAFFGCLYAGIVAVPIHPPRNRHAIDEVQRRLRSCQATVVLTHHSLLSKLKGQLTPCAPSEPLHWLTTDHGSIAAADWQAPDLREDTLAFLQYTSGSTGMPKGVMVTHQCILRNEQMLKLAFGNSDATITVGWLPLFHDMGLIGNVLQPMYLGVHCVLMSPIDFVQKPVRWVQAVSRYRATISGGPNFAYDLLCRHVSEEQRSQLDLSSWQVAFCGAEPVRVATIDRFTHAFAACGFRRHAFYPCYGMAEATLFITGGQSLTPILVCHVDRTALQQNQVVPLPHPTEQTRSIVSCGHPWLDLQVAIVDPISHQPCPPDRVGEIWVNGSSVGKGYWHQPDETNQTFRATLPNSDRGFLRTGDLGFLWQGNLFITGRLKETLILWGFNHYPHHIEQTIEQAHPGFRPNGCAVFTVEVAGEERLVALQEVERRYCRSIHINDIADSIHWAVFQQHFADLYAIVLLKPSYLPRTSSGKIQRQQCQAQFLQGLDGIAEWRSPYASDISSLLKHYFNPGTHLRRYLARFKARVRRIGGRRAEGGRWKGGGEF
ncbi:MAG: fatty acyl-AMP ligase [Leptolyngbyaceae cyanobacterium SL_7_1]|nr:fatty acyl-AMP ligase [Leptolyngbyaceae cyanobacterium SL_7_1]